MKIKKDLMDKVAYICLCVITLGFVALVRVIISEAIRQAIQNDKGENE